MRALRARAKSFCASSAGKPVPTVPCGSGPLLAGADGVAVERVVERRDEREHAVQARDLERLHDRVIVADDHERALALPQPAVGPDQHPEARGVDEGRAREVDDEPGDAVVDRLRHALLELGRGEEVDLARHGDDMDPLAGPPVLDLEVDRHQLVYASRTSRYSESPSGATEMSSASCSMTLPTPGTVASRMSASPRRGRSGPTRRNRVRSPVSRSTSTEAAWTCAGARDAMRSATSTASSRRSSGRSARAASIPTTRRSTGPTSGPLAMETRVVPREPVGLAAASLTLPRSGPRRTTSRPGCPGRRHRRRPRAPR